MSVIADPVIAQFVERVAVGTNAAADSVAGLVLRLVGRVGALERKVEAQSSQIAKIDKLARAKPAPVVALAPIMTGVDTATGAAVRIMPKRSRGRPPGSKDRHQRPPRARHHDIEAEISSNHILDDDWDHLGAG
jgi:hypothetical protein